MARGAGGGRPARGSIEGGWRRNAETGVIHWHARITLPNGSREWVPLDPRIPRDDVDGAKACAAMTSERARELGAVRGDAETVREWFKRFHAMKEARGFSTVREMRGRANKWLLDIIGEKTMAGLTREDIERIVRRLDRAVVDFMAHGPGAGRLAPSTAVNVWGDLQHALDEAVTSKDVTLRVLTVSPAHDVRGPEGGDDRQGQILYSDEVLALLRGEAVDPGRLGVPLYRRQVYAMAIYSKARASELEALEVTDVDLAHATISISKQADRASKGRKGVKKTKTKRVRTVDVEPHAYALVAALVKHPQGKGARLVRLPPPEDRAELLRKDLRTVGVTRAALHIEHDPMQRALTFHDLRDTGLTHMAVRGDSPIVIQWAGGHTDFKTTQGYIERGQTERRRIGEPLPPLPPGLLPKGGEVSAEVSAKPNPQTETPKPPEYLMVTPMGIEGALENTTNAENTRAPRDPPSDVPRESSSPSSPLATSPQPLARPEAEPSDEDLERAIVAAMLDGRGAVAELLTQKLKARRLACAGNNVIAIGAKRQGR